MQERLKQVNCLRDLNRGAEEQVDVVIPDDSEEDAKEEDDDTES